MLIEFKGIEENSKVLINPEHIDSMYSGNDEIVSVHMSGGNCSYLVNEPIDVVMAKLNGAEKPKVDVEKVRNGLKRCFGEGLCCESCPYRKAGCQSALLKDALKVMTQEMSK